MKANHEVLEDHCEECEAQLKGLNSYLKELHTMTAKHGTDKEQFADDVIEAEHNIKYYQAEIAVVKKELGGSGHTGGGHSGGVPTSPPLIPKPALSSLIFSSIGFIAGALFGSKRSSRKADKDSR
jgi:hypothetical protein